VEQQRHWASVNDSNQNRRILATSLKDINHRAKRHAGKARDQSH
jgi:hypothetical protein